MQLFNKFIYYWQDAAKWQPTGIKFTHRLIISIFRPTGRLIAPIHVKLGLAEGHVGLLSHAKFRTIGSQEWERSPQNLKNCTFWQRVAP